VLGQPATGTAADWLAGHLKQTRLPAGN
jgi:hypothetical protein